MLVIFDTRTRKIGVVKYYKEGTNGDRNIKDRRVPLYGDMDVLDEAIMLAIQKDYKESYRNYVLSFEEDDMTPEKLKRIVESFIQQVTSGYKEGEVVIYAEAHYPKIKTKVNDVAEVIKRRIHAHVSFARYSPILDKAVDLGHHGSLDEYGKTKVSKKAGGRTTEFELWKKQIEKEYGLKSFQEQDKTAIKKDFTELTPSLHSHMKQRKIAVEITNKLINEHIYDINSPEDLIKVLQKHPQISKIDTKTDKRGNPYLSIHIDGIKRPIKKTGALFSQNKEAFRIALKRHREDLTKEPPESKILESGKPRPVPKSDRDRLAELTSKRIKYINEREYSKRTKLGLNRLLDIEHERMEYEIFKKRAKASKNKENKKDKEYLNNYYKMPKSVAEAIIETVLINEIMSYQQKIFYKLYKAKIELDLKNYYVDIGNPKKIIFTNNSKQVKVIDEGNKIKALSSNTKEQVKLMIKIAIAKGWNLNTLVVNGDEDFRKAIHDEIMMYQIALNPLQQQIMDIKSEQEEGSNHDIKVVKEELTAQFLLNTLDDKYKFEGLYAASKNRDGKERIQVGTRQLNVADFLTKEIGLPWREAEPLLISLYQQQKQNILNEDLLKSKRDNLLFKLDDFAKNNGSRKILDLVEQEQEIDSTYYASKSDTIINKKISNAREEAITVSMFLDEIHFVDNDLEKLLDELKYVKEREKLRSRRISTKIY
jgi:hypothetical protein